MKGGGTTPLCSFFMPMRPFELKINHPRSDASFDYMSLRCGAGNVMMSRRRFTARLHDFIQPLVFSALKEFLLCLSLAEVMIIAHCPAPTWSESCFGLKKEKKRNRTVKKHEE